MTTITFETVLSEQIGPLTWRATRMVGDAQTAEDLRQETLARAWRSAPRDMPAPALRAWLHRTTTNLALDELRRRRRRDEVALSEVAGVRSDAEPEAREALATLTAHERLVLLLRHEAGLSLRELGSRARHLRGRGAQARRPRQGRVRRRARATCGPTIRAPRSSCSWATRSPRATWPGSSVPAPASASSTARRSAST